MNTTIMPEALLLLGVRIGDVNPSSAISCTVLSKSPGPTLQRALFSCLLCAWSLMVLPGCLPKHKGMQEKPTASPGTCPRVLLIPATLI